MPARTPASFQAARNAPRGSIWKENGKRVSRNPCLATTLSRYTDLLSACHSRFPDLSSVRVFDLKALVAKMCIRKGKFDCFINLLRIVWNIDDI